MLHHEIEGPLAIHPFAFVQSTDPALDADNHVAAGKAWIDTGSANTLKIRNEANSAWIIVVGGSSDAVVAFTLLESIVSVLVDVFPNVIDATTIGDFTELTYV